MPNTSATGGYLIPTSAALLEDDALVDVLTAAVAGVTGLDGTLVRPKWQSKPAKRPAAAINWCALGITEDTPNDSPYIVHDPNGAAGVGEDQETRHEAFTVLVSFYGPNSKGFAKLLRDGLQIPQNLEELQNNSISFISAGTIRAVPESVNMQWITRYDMLLSFRRMVTRTYSVQTIATAGVELHVNDKVSTINITQ